VATSAIESLYAKYPPLSAADAAERHRLEPRREILRLLAPGTVGAELGVFTGMFAEVIAQDVRPAVFHLVDPWWRAYGEHYPDWGLYTDEGRLPTAAAHEAAEARAALAPPECDVQVHVMSSQGWLASLGDHTLDWVYLDSTHEYKDTLAELTLLAAKIRPHGLVLGDDWWPDVSHVHHGVFRAVHEVVRAGAFDLVRADAHTQWAIRPAAGYSLVRRARKAALRRFER
jgi:Methyltransferase domain